MNPTVLEVRQEVGIDLVVEGHPPKIAAIDALQAGDRVVSMGCGVYLACPVPLGEMADWALDDPKDPSMAKVRESRDSIEDRVSKLVFELGVAR